MTFEPIRFLGLENLLGNRGSSRIGCTLNAFDANNNLVETFSLEFTQNVDGVTSDVLYNEIGGLFQGRHARNTSLRVNGTTNSPCATTVDVEQGHVEASAVRTITTENSGVFELEALMFAFAGVVILTAVIRQGIKIARKGVNAINEETTEEDHLYYYEGRNGKEYYGVKRKF